jgi:hypothetical protein
MEQQFISSKYNQNFNRKLEVQNFFTSKQRCNLYACEYSYNIQKLCIIKPNPCVSSSKTCAV